MADPRDIFLEEYKQVRAEMNNRTTMAYGLVALDLTALGLGVTAFEKLPHVVLGLSLISTFLWVIWMDHAGQVYKMASYIALRLAPQLSSVGFEVLGWERFLRNLDQGGDRAEKALSGGTVPSATPSESMDVPQTFNVSIYMSLLFGGIPPGLLIAYLLSPAAPADLRLRLVIGALFGLVWGPACYQYLKFSSFVAKLGEIIVNQEAQPRPEPRTSAPPASTSVVPLATLTATSALVAMTFWQYLRSRRPSG